ncbi:MAG TPA: PHP domain-containing protein [Micromonosporaceae bacterium]|jgi:putative hydrolase
MRDPAADLKQIAFLLEQANESTFRVRSFRSAAKAVAAVPADELARRADAGTLAELSGIGDVTARCITESLRGEEPVYLRRLLATEGTPTSEAAAALRTALRGDCHMHSDWSDGGSPIEEMALAGAQLGHEYIVMTDHSPRLKVARGLTAERLEQQLDVIEAFNAELPDGFRVLTGIEVDILADGTLDQSDELLARLDIVVGSLHSNLRDESAAMTRRMVRAIASPHLDILGHCTNRKLTAKGVGDRGHNPEKSRPESGFDAAAVFAACVEYGKAVEINCRPDRLDPPKRLLRIALEAGCDFSIDTDAHAPGQLAWLDNGCERAALCGVPAERIVNTWHADRLLDWAAGHA